MVKINEATDTDSKVIEQLKILGWKTWNYFTPCPSPNFKRS